MKIEQAIEILIKKYKEKSYNIDYSGGNSLKEYHFIKDLESLINPPKAKADKKQGFDDFWNLYPKKVDKVNAQKKWASMELYKPEKSAGLFASLTNQLNSKDERFKREKEYIMGPAKYLLGQCWNDEIIQKKEHKKEWLTDAQVDSMARSGESYVDLFARLSAQGYNFNNNRS